MQLIASGNTCQKRDVHIQNGTSALKRVVHSLSTKDINENTVATYDNNLPQLSINLNKSGPSFDPRSSCHPSAGANLPQFPMKIPFNVRADQHSTVTQQITMISPKYI